MISKIRPVTIYTLLREPRSRIVSSFHHIQRSVIPDDSSLNTDEWQAYRLIQEQSFEKFCHQLNTEKRFWDNFFNVQTRFLSSHHVTSENWSQIGEDQILKDALQNLDKIDFVADVNDFHEFTQLIALANHWLPPGQSTTLNRGNYHKDSADDMASLVPDSHVALDQVIYEAGLKKYHEWRERVLHEATVNQWRNSSQHQQLPELSGEEWELNFENTLHAENFHGREGTGNQTFRWMGPDLKSRLYIPVRPDLAHWISVYVVAFIKPELYSTTIYTINGKEVTPIGSTAEDCTVLTFPVDSNQTASGVVELRIQTAETDSEVALNLGTDTREKSIAIRRVKVSLRPPG